MRLKNLIDIKAIKNINSAKLINKILMPIGLFASYCGSFLFIYTMILNLPKSVNYYFVRLSLKYSLLFFVITSALLLIIRIYHKNNYDKFVISREKIYTRNLILILFPLAPIMRYILSNRNILSIYNVFIIILISILFSGLYIIVLPYFLKFISVPEDITMSLGTAFVFTLLFMPTLSNLFSWSNYGNYLIQLIILVFVFTICLGLLRLKSEKFILFLVIAYFISNNLFIISQELKGNKLIDQTSEEKILSLIDGKKPRITPSIYLLVYDAYVNNETMMSYGIDNKSQEKFLEGEGFKIYSNTYSIGAGTISTMSRVLNASRDYYGDIRRGVSGDGVVHQALRTIGYKTYGLFPYDYMFINTGSHYDYSIPKMTTETHTLLLSAILEGDFRFDIGFDEIPYEDFVESKREIINEISDFPVFVYMHSRLPGHSQNSGVCRIDETDIYERNLYFSNIEMKEDLITINLNDPNAIIIIAGDHGPYLTKNCHDTEKFYDISEISRQDLQDRFGTFLAIKWPDDQNHNYDKITIIQDLFPVILTYIYDDPNFLDLKISSRTEDSHTVSGVYIDNCIIHGGKNDREFLYETCKFNP